jgi:7-cyano-7-deazaguanine synthase
MDSTACLNHVSKKHGPENVTALTIKYGSLHNHRERKAAMQVLSELGVQGEVIKLPDDIFKGAGSALMGEGDIPEGEYITSGPQDTIVPFRNGTFLLIATAIASRHGRAEVWLAAHADDAEEWAYPDCTPPFLEAMAEAIHIATIGEVRLIAPFQYMTKSQIVEQAYHEDAPLELSYSCYKGNRQHCGVCATCIDRHYAFNRAGFKDPTVYEAPLVESSLLLRAYKGEHNG